MDTSKIFGENGDFSITYRTCPVNYNYTEENKMAICHLVIGNIIIGELEEECYLPTWFFQITRIRNFFTANKTGLYSDAFINLSDREIYELVIKSNQVEGEFDTNYLYLPQLDNEIWRRHYLTIDETIDGFCICYFVKGDNIRFIIERVWPEVSDEKQRIFFYKTIDFNNFISTLNQTIEFLKIEYPYLINHDHGKN